MYNKQYNTDAVKSPIAAIRRDETSANIEIESNKDKTINDASDEDQGDFEPSSCCTYKSG
jgi:hypothetical protein